ncbi:MAG: cation transporter [Planctomycetia bacterium]|nr:cation transporter [Planctomycetia bacterium]
MRFPFLLSIASTALTALAYAQDASEPKEEGVTVVKATYLITGLHCPPCTKTVESSLRQIDGVKSVKVDWKTKNAKIEFDEAVLPAQKLALLIADTPHMMGGNLHYDGWLALKASEIMDDASAERAKEALSKLEGVKRVVAYPKKHSLGVQFTDDGEVTSHQLIEALTAAGFTGENY